MFKKSKTSQKRTGFFLPCIAFRYYSEKKLLYYLCVTSSKKKQIPSLYFPVRHLNNYLQFEPIAKLYQTI